MVLPLLADIRVDPVYFAVRVSVPTGKLEVFNTAVPVLLKETFPSNSEPT